MIDQQQYWPNQPIQHPIPLREPQFGVNNLELGVQLDNLQPDEAPESLTTSQRLKDQARPAFASKSEMFQNIKPQPSASLQKVVEQLLADMRELYAWDQSERDPARQQAITDAYASGAVCLQKAALADRLHRKKLAEKQYRKCVDVGTSYFAWWRLLKHYEKTEQPKAVLVCVAEILDRAEEDKVRVWEGYPEDNFEETDSEDEKQSAADAKKKKKKEKSDKRPKTAINARSRNAVLGRYPAWVEQALARQMAKVGYKTLMKHGKDVDVLDQKQLVRILTTRLKDVNKGEGFDR